jgi:DNA-directed RNA polymerase beta' subunit
MELFQPFIIQKMFKFKLVNTIKEAKKKMLNKTEITNKILKIVVKNL